MILKKSNFFEITFERMIVIFLIIIISVGKFFYSFLKKDE